MTKTFTAKSNRKPRMVFKDADPNNPIPYAERLKALKAFIKTETAERERCMALVQAFNNW